MHDLVSAQCQKCKQDFEFVEELHADTVYCPHCNARMKFQRAEPLPRSQPEPEKTNIPVPKFLQTKWLVSMVAVGLLAGAALWVSGPWLIKHAADAGLLAGGLIGITIYLLLLFMAFILACMWALFPLIAYYGLKQANQHLRAIEQNTRHKNY